MATYTFITDFQGGTYICQKDADDLRSACKQWKDELASGGYVQHLNAKAFVKAFDADIDELPPVNLDELENVWIFQLLLGDDMLNVHIVQTDTSQVGEKTITSTYR